MNRKLHYLATPIRHADPGIIALRYNFNLLAVHTLRMAGYLVYSPMLHYMTVANTFNWPADWSFWKEPSLEMVSRCDGGIILLRLDGWLDSVGVGAELAWAKSRGLDIMTMDDPEQPNLKQMDLSEVVDLSVMPADQNHVQD